MKELGLYIHIPFCMSKCAYCDFYSLPKAELHGRYVDALCESAHLMSEKISDRLFTSVYIGGGTPSILSADLLKKLFSSIKECFSLDSQAEFTIEANPATLTNQKLSAMVEGGVNRLSLGCQSAIDNELKKLSRLHSFEEFRQSFLMSRDHGLENISVDLMYGIPYQTMPSLLYSINSIAALSPDHISLYGLRVEPDTPFGRDKGLILPDDDEQCDMYLAATETLDGLGYKRYEISNFARDGKFSRHNMRYWECCEYLGLGAAAHSYVDGMRYAYPRDALLYISSIENGKMPNVCERVALTKEDMLSEYIMLSLRLERGLSLNTLGERFGEENIKSLLDKTAPYIPEFMTLEGSCLKFTNKGFLVSNTILSEII